jgi:FMN phosphatase YigB (HAD superfamily)
MTHIFLIISLLFPAATHTQTLFISHVFPTKESAKNYFKQVKPAFLWDLHGVLFLPSSAQLIQKTVLSKKTFFTCPVQIIRAVGSYKNWKKITKEVKKGTITYDAYCEIFRQYPDLYTVLIQSANNLYTPNPAVLDMVKNLHNQGYDNYLFSNIGPIVLNDLKNRYPLEFVYFKHSGRNLINPIIPTVEQWLAKPQPAAYSTAMSFVGTKPEDIIFIDDSKDKIAAALKAGWNCILYKNPQQLIHDLETFTGYYSQSTNFNSKK